MINADKMLESKYTKEDKMKKEIYVFEGELTENLDGGNKKINGIEIDRILDPFVFFASNKKVRITIEEI